METANPDFSSVEPRNLTGRHITEKMLHDMKAYQKELINSMLYEQVISKCGKPKQLVNDRLLDEIKRVEQWLKVKWSEFIHDNNRKMSA